jgi:hypothetical protein
LARICSVIVMPAIAYSSGQLQKNRKDSSVAGWGGQFYRRLADDVVRQ